eukprot:m.52104 g.52104  ORF g.52104 m.52104 type:complete len:64 (-) comp10984_c0_seq6:333-524(-)
MMNSVNPAFILRNFVAQEAIEMAERGDFSGVRSVLERVKNPYTLSKDQTLQKTPVLCACVCVL